MSEEINHGRRRFLGAAAMTAAAGQLSMRGSPRAQSGKTQPVRLLSGRPRAEHLLRHAQTGRCRGAERWIRRKRARLADPW